MKQAISILIGYLTCTDPVMVTKWGNILASFWHKDEGSLVTSIEQDAAETNITIKDGEGATTTTSIPTYTEPSTFEIGKIEGLSDALEGKVNTEVGKGLSTEDFTNELKEKLEQLQNYVHPEGHNIAEIDGLQDVLSGFADGLAALGSLLDSLNQYQYVIWNGYRLYKHPGNVEMHPQAGEEVKGRGDGSLFGGEIIHATAKIDTDEALDANFNLLNSYP